MEKVKSNKFSSVFSILKCCLIGVVVTLIGTLVLALILKFADLSSNVVSYLNDVVKMLALFTTISCLKKVDGQKLILKSIFAGIIYAILCFVIFSILNGRFAFNLSILYDVLFAVIVAVIVTIIINLFRKK